LAPPEDPLDFAAMDALNIDGSAFVREGAGKYFPQSYALLQNMAGIIQTHRGGLNITG
jgi:hypothetical protein